MLITYMYLLEDALGSTGPGAIYKGIQFRPFLYVIFSDFLVREVFFIEHFSQAYM